MNLSLENVVVKVAQETSGIKHKAYWCKYSEDELWFELVACNLGSRIKYEVAKVAVQRLKTLGLLRHCRFISNSIDLEINISNALNSQLNIVIDGKTYKSRYPYPYLKAKHIVDMASSIYSDGHTLVDILNSYSSAQEARSFLITKAPGIGAKQASLFLRNIGYSNELAVLDVHVLRYMSYVGLLPNVIKSISSVVKYEAIENLFRVYSRKLNLRIDSLDIAIWVVMRAAQGKIAI